MRSPTIYIKLLWLPGGNCDLGREGCHPSSIGACDHVKSAPTTFFSPSRKLLQMRYLCLVAFLAAFALLAAAATTRAATTKAAATTRATTRTTVRATTRTTARATTT
eukprot:m.236918 g.236918  ORF g.236918 m.236918 type:complete len:107 (+) comp20837_c0_seq1:630-950(+)